MRRRSHRPSSLTSMIDVVFILVFAALAQRTVSASLATEGEPTPVATPTSDAGPVDSRAEISTSDYASIRRAGLTAAEAALSRGEAIVVRVSMAGHVEAIERAEHSQRIAVPLLERVANPDVALAYLGDRSPELQICSIARRYVEIDGRLVIIALAGLIDDLRVALARGLRRDVERCRRHGAMAVLIEATESGAP